MIVLHIGTMKTGSTAIQKLITVNRDLFEKQGWFYPEKVGNLGFNHARLAMSLQKNESDVLEEFKKELKESSLENTLLSFENFCLMNEEQIEQLLSAFDPEDKSEVKIIVYLRRQDDQKESFLMQEVKEGRLAEFNLYNYHYEPVMDYYSMIEKWSKFIKKENIIIRPYGKQFLPNKYSLYEDFFQHALNIDFNKIKDMLVIPQTDANPSLSAVSGYVASFFDNIIKDEVKLTFISQLLAIQNRYGKSKSYLFNREERKKILSLYDSSNKALIENYKVPRELFELDHKEYEKPTEEEIGNILSLLYKRKDYLLPLLQWGGTETFAHNVNTHNIELLNGFHELEYWGVWTNGNEVSKLAFLVFRDFYNGAKYLNIKVNSHYLTNSNTVSLMKIGDSDWMEINGITQYKLSAEEVRLDGGIVFIEFKHENAISPKELDDSINDPRVLGCAIDSINFEEIL